MLRKLRNNRRGQTVPIIMFIIAILIFSLMFFLLHGIVDPIFAVALNWNWGFPIIGQALGWWINIFTYGLIICSLLIFLVWMITNSKRGPYEE